MSLFGKKYSEKTDEELMSLLVKNEQPAFDELYGRYSKPLFNFFYRMLNFEREKAEDFLHDLFLKIIEKPKSFDNSQRFSVWFYAIAANMIKNEYRNLQVRNEFGHFLESRQDEEIVFYDDNIDKQQFELHLQIEINKLDVETKTLFNLRFVEEMSLKDIAEVMKCPEGTVKSRLFYLTKYLAKKLSIYKPD